MSFYLEKMLESVVQYLYIKKTNLRYNMSELLKDKINIIDLKNINWDTVYLHYTNKSNLNDIIENGLQPRKGINAKVIEKSKKYFFYWLQRCFSNYGFMD